MLEGILSQYFLVAFAALERILKALPLQVLLLAPHYDTFHQSLEHPAAPLSLEIFQQILLRNKNVECLPSTFAMCTNFKR